MTDWTQRILNNYANKQASESNKLKLSNFGSAAAPTDFDLQANNYQGMITQGIGGLVKFAQAGERRREEARKEAIGAEGVNYQREQDAANLALKVKDSDRADKQLANDTMVLDRAKQKEAAKSRAAGYLIKSNDIGKTLIKHRSDLNDLVRQNDGFNFFQGTKDGKNLIGDFSGLDKKYATYQANNKDKKDIISKEDFYKKAEEAKANYDTLRTGILEGENQVSANYSQYRDDLLKAQATPSLADDIAEVGEGKFNYSSPQTNTQKAIIAEEKAQVNKQMQDEIKKRGKGSDEDIFLTDLQSLSKYGPKASTQLDGYLSNLGDSDKEDAGEIRKQVNELYTTFKDSVASRTHSDQEILLAAIRGTMRAKGNTDYSILGAGPGKIFASDAAKYADAELSGFKELKAKSAQGKNNILTLTGRLNMLSGLENASTNSGSLLFK